MLFTIHLIMTFAILSLFTLPSIRLNLTQICSLLRVDSVHSVKTDLDLLVGQGRLKVAPNDAWVRVYEKVSASTLVHLMQTLMNHGSLTKDGWSLVVVNGQLRSYACIDPEEKQIRLSSWFASKCGDMDTARAVICLSVVRAIQGKDEQKLAQRASELGADKRVIARVFSKVTIKKQRDSPRKSNKKA